MESGGVPDCISITDRTESMSSISQEKAEIAAHVPELFCLKKFICSDTELISTGKVAIFFSKHMLIPENIKKNGGLELYLKSESQLTRNELLWQCLSRLTSCISSHEP